MEMLGTGLLLGLLGSMHCVGMCGPIALALPSVKNSTQSRLTGIFLYNAGRVITYGLLGFIFGLFGKSFVIAGYQQALSVGLGILILFFLLLPQRYFQGLQLRTGLFQPVTKLKTALGRLFKTASYSSLLSIGILNGLLPCGFVYMAIAGAIAVANPLRGGLFMIFFGLGTVPAMLGLMLAGQKMSLSLRNHFKKASPVFVSLVAVLLILRGLNLGIPYLSPELDKKDCTIHNCCHK